MVPISLLVPAYNESATIVDSVRNLTSDFPEYEVIVVNDGSKDDTLQLLIEAFELLPFHQPYKKSLQTEEIVEIYRSALDEKLIVLNKKERKGGCAQRRHQRRLLSRHRRHDRRGFNSGEELLIKIIYSFISDPTCIAVGGIVRIGSAARSLTASCGK
ncbi:MAG: glycosyltransferase [Eubacteriales bacterium]